MKTIGNLLALILSVVVLFSGCKYDDDDLWDAVNEQAERIAALETWQSTVNSNITALQKIVTALQDNDYVKEVVAFETPAPGGYRISFTKSGDATILNGAKGEKGETGETGPKGDTGATGHSPDISAKEFPEESGVYYWTLDGEFIEAGGEKIPLTGDKGENGGTGADGKTPKVIIGEDGYWYVSADGSATGTPSDGSGWETTGVKATGEDGKPGQQGEPGPKGDYGDAIFAANGINNDDPDFVIFTLADEETTITLPRYKSIGISFTQAEMFIAGQDFSVEYTSNGYSAPTDVRVTSIPAGWNVSVDKDNCKFIITPPADFEADGIEFGKATIYLDEGNKIAGMYNLELLNGVNNTVGAVYYRNGVATGVVARVNDGINENSGLIVHKDPITQIESAGELAGSIDFDCSTGTGAELMAAIQEGFKNTWENLTIWKQLNSIGNGWAIATNTDIEGGNVPAMCKDALNSLNDSWSSSENTSVLVGKVTTSKILGVEFFVFNCGEGDIGLRCDRADYIGDGLVKNLIAVRTF